MVVMRPAVSTGYFAKNFSRSSASFAYLAALSAIL